MEEDAHTIFNFDFELRNPSAEAYRRIISKEIEAVENEQKEVYNEEGEPQDMIIE